MGVPSTNYLPVLCTTDIMCIWENTIIILDMFYIGTRCIWENNKYIYIRTYT